MQRMIRKQIYIEKDQNKELMRAARASGVSQAELIRRRIGERIADLSETPGGNDREWKKAIKVMRERAGARGRTKERRIWTREDLYDR